MEIVASSHRALLAFEEEACRSPAGKAVWAGSGRGVLGSVWQWAVGLGSWDFFFRAGWQHWSDGGGTKAGKLQSGEVVLTITEESEEKRKGKREKLIIWFTGWHSIH